MPVSRPATTVEISAHSSTSIDASLNRGTYAFFKKLDRTPTCTTRKGRPFRSSGTVTSSTLAVPITVCSCRTTPLPCNRANSVLAGSGVPSFCGSVDTRVNPCESVTLTSCTQELYRTSESIVSSSGSWLRSASSTAFASASSDPSTGGSARSPTSTACCVIISTCRAITSVVAAVSAILCVSSSDKNSTDRTSTIASVSPVAASTTFVFSRIQHSVSVRGPSPQQTSIPRPSRGVFLQLVLQRLRADPQDLRRPRLVVIRRTQRL